jgi:hypothetical protein
MAQRNKTDLEEFYDSLKGLDSWTDKENITNIGNQAKSLRVKYALEQRNYSRDSAQYKQYQSLLDSLDESYNYISAKGKEYGAFDTGEAYSAALNASVDPSKAYAEFATPDYGQAGWGQYLADKDAAYNAQKEAEAKKPWWQKGMDAYHRAEVGSDHVLNYAQAVDDLRKDDSYMKPQDGWSDEQKWIYGYLYSSDRNKATEYATEINKYNNEVKESEILRKIAEQSTSSFWAGAGNTLGAIASAPLGLVDTLYNLALASAGRELVVADGMVTPFEYSQAVTGAIGTNLNNEYGTLDESIPIIGGAGWGDVYGLGTSIAQSTLSAYTLGGAGTLISYFGQGAAAGIKDAKQRGASDEQAILYGVSLGAFEGIAESIGVEKLFKLSSSKTLKALFGNILKQAGSEGTEEALTTVLSNVADLWIMQDKSELYALYQQYIDQGMSEDAAFVRVFGKFANDVGFDALGGAISGGVHAGGHTAIQNLGVSSHGKTLIENKAVDPLQVLANEMAGVSSDVDLLSAKVGKKQSAGNVGRLSLALNEAVSKQNRTELVNSLTKSGISPKQAEKIADTLANKGTVGKKYASDSAVKKAVDDSKANAKYRESRLAMAKFGFSPSGRISTTGKSTQISTGNEIKIDRRNAIAKVEGDTVYYNTNAGVVPASDIEFANSVEAKLYEGLTDIPTVTANAIIKNYDGKTPIDTYIEGMRMGVMTYGKNHFQGVGKDISADTTFAELSESDQQYALKLGENLAKYEARKGEQKVAAKKAVSETSTEPKKRRKGSVSFMDGATVDKKDLERRSAVHLARYLATTMGIDIVFYDSALLDKESPLRGGNGAYDTKNNTIYLDLQYANTDKKTIAFTLSHELVHFIKKWSPTKFDTLAKFLMEQYAEHGVDTAALLRRKAAKYDSDEAFEEMIADACEKLLVDSNAVVKLAKLREIDLSLFEKIRVHILTFLNKIRSMYKKYEGNLSDEAKALQSMTDALEQIYSLFEEAAVTATENYQASIGSRDLADFSEAKTPNGDMLFQHKAIVADEAKYREMLTKWGGLSKEQTDNLFATVDKAVAIIKDNLEALDYAWEADIDDRAFSPVKQNSDKLYQVSLDFSTLCRKRILQQTIQAHLQEALNKSLSKEEGIAIRDALMALQEEGRQIEVACALCYVESARMKSPAQIEKFLKNKETVLKEFFAGKSGGSMKEKLKQAEADAREKMRQENPNGIKGKDGKTMLDPRDAKLKELPKKYADEIRNAKKEAKAAYKPTAEEQNLIDIAKGLTVNDFTTPEGLEVLAKDYPRLFDAYTSYIRNATKSKGIENDTWWRAGDSQKIGDVLIANMNKENGLRSQSWSDFQVVHILDYIAATIELSTRNAKEQAYTKVPDYAELMGNTGVMINLSLIPTATFNGKLEYDSVEGMAYKRALELRDKYHATVGTICIGVDNTQIKLLLGDVSIDYVIPYHKSGMSAAIRKVMHIPTWTQYEEYQSESKLSRTEAEKRAKKYGVELLDSSDPNYQKAPLFSEWFDIKVAQQIAKMENANPSDKAKHKEYGVMYGGYMAMQDAANKYLKLCAERGLSPKFSHEKADFTGEANYWKLLIDRKMVDNITGEIIEQQTIKPIFDEGEVLRILNDELARYPGVKADQEYATRKVTEAFLSGDIKGGMSAKKIAEIMKTPVDNITKTNILASSEGDAGLKKQIKDSYRDNPFISAVTNTVADYDNRGAWSGNFIKEVYQTHPEYDFLRRIYKGDKSAIADLKNLVDSIDDVELLENINWYPIYTYDSESRKASRKAINAYKKVVNSRIQEIMEATVNGTDVGMETREYTLEEIRSMFDALNSNTDIAKLADKVFKTAANLNLKIRGVRSIDGDAKALGGQLFEQIAYKVPYLNDKGVSDQEKARVLLHELIHGCTTYAIRAKEKYLKNYPANVDRYGLDYKMTQAVEQLQRVYKDISNDPLFKGEYGAKSVYEMVAELSNMEFREKLQKRNLWSRIVEAIKMVFGIETKTQLDGVSAALEYILDNVDRTQYDRYVNQDSQANRAAGKMLFAENIRLQKKDTSNYAPTFYSHMGKVIDGIKMDKIGSASLIPFLKGKGVKHDEIKWSGIEAFLEGKKSVTKAELQEFIAGSQLEIEEQISSNQEYTEYMDWARTVAVTVNRHEDGDVTVWSNETPIEFYYDEETEIYTDEYDREYTEDELDEFIEKEREFWLEESGDIPNPEGAARWSEYKLDGGSNYRELVFKMPNSTYTNQAMQTHWGYDAEGILAHARIQDMTTADGKKMLFIEEIQSDWHNEGHNRGYVDESKLVSVENTDLFKNKYGTYELYHNGEYLIMIGEARLKQRFPNGITEEQIHEGLVEQYNKEQSNDSNNSPLVPDAPFRTTYHEYVLKRLLRMAAEEGYDSIGWTPADIQSERWSEDYAEGYRIEYDQDIPKFLRKYGKKWGATVGKTAIPSYKPSETYYDANKQQEYTDIIEWQNDVEREIKAQGSSLDTLWYESKDTYWVAFDEFSGVEYARAEIRKQSGSVWSMDITEPMKESVLYEGQMKFQKKDSDGNELSDAQMEFFKDSKVRDADGNLRVMYHGTTSKFTIFDIERAGRNWNGDSRLGKGFYFANTKEEALRWTDGSITVKAYLNLVNPLDLDAPTPKDIADEIDKYITNKLASFDESNAWISRKQYAENLHRIKEMYMKDSALFIDNFKYDDDGKMTDGIREFLSSLGYDGIVSKQETVAFYPEQIKETTNKNPTNNPDIRFQKKEVSNRTILANALESTIDTSTQKGQNELRKLKEYQKLAADIDKMDERLAEVRKEIHDISFTKGSDRSKLSALNDEKTKLRNRINLLDIKLTKLESMKPIQDVLEREKNKVRKKAEKEGREALEREHKRMEIANRWNVAEEREKRRIEKEKSEAKIAELKAHHKEEQKKKTVRKNKTELRKKIRKVSHDLETLLNHSTKDRNIKKGLQEVVSATVKLGKLFSGMSNADIVNSNIAVTKEESAFIDEYRKLLNKRKELLAKNAKNVKNLRGESLNEEMNRIADEVDLIQQRIAELDVELEDVFGRERARLYNEPVSNFVLKLAAEYEKIQSSKDNYIKGAYDSVVYDNIKALGNSLGNTLVGDLTLEQLEAIHGAVAMVKHMVTKSNTIFRDGKREQLETRAGAIHRQLRWSEKIKKDPIAKTEDAKNGIKDFLWNEMKPLTAFEALGSEAFTELFMDAVMADGEFGKFITEAGDYLQEQRAKFNYADWDIDTVREFTLVDGKVFRVTVGDIMSIYAYSKRTQADKHMVEGGFVFDENNHYKERLFDFKSQNVITNALEKLKVNRKHARLTDTYLMGDAVIGDILKLVYSPEYADIKGYVDAMQDYFKVMAEKGNKVSNELFGIDLFTEEFYIPLQSKNDYLDSNKEALSQTETQVSLKNTGMTKPTVPHANNPIVLRQFDEIWLDHIDKMANYCSYVLPIENLQKVFNFVTSVDGQSPVSTKALISSIFGNEAKGYIDQYLKDLNGGSRGASGYKSPMMSMFAKFKKTVVGAKLSVMVQQPFAVIRAMTEIDPKYFLPFLGSQKTHGVKVWDELKEYAPVAIVKEMGGHDIGSPASVKNYIGTTQYHGVKNKAKAMVKDSTYRNQNIDNAFTAGAAMADVLGWDIIWLATKKEIAAQKKYVVGSKEFLDACGKRFTEVVLRTQVYDSVNTRSGMMRSKSDVLKFATSFMGEPTTVINMLVSDAIRLRNAFRYEDGRLAASKRMARTLGVVTASIVITALAKSAIYANYDDDENESWTERWMRNFGESLSSDLNPMTMLPFLRDIVSIYEGWSIERPDMTLVADLVASAKKLMDDGATNEEICDFAGDIASAFGIPAKNISKDLHGIINLVQDHFDSIETADAFGAFKRGWTDTDTNYDDLYTAVRSGRNLKAVMRRYKDNGMTEAEIANLITRYFRAIYKEMSRTDKARLKGYLLNAYVMLGYDRAKKSKEIDSWG